MPMPHGIDIREVIGSHPVSRFQGLVIALGFLVVAIDGFDEAATSALGTTRSTLFPPPCARAVPIGAIAAGPARIQTRIALPRPATGA
ncbi:hypothetical protein [Paracraurococcus lichenis]|uniref:Uncharacterized protein n=1 Tax=Paracraurococcus lichenis TaxID=3064888 RepID=A0ABT9E686_9PROT|nr:hypothetical protein [Paracraurococcus sp. LOR1-02]MDO9711612.1 hypothetical protein [Paracraurococcus sp. LOR1-02]